MQFFKIFHSPTGLFKESGLNGRFNRMGKLWRLQTLKSHLRQFERYHPQKLPLEYDIEKQYNIGDGYKLKFSTDECQVIEYELVERRRIPLIEFIQNEMEKKNE